ncbi:sorting nexin-10 isoform X2 [Oryzias latipes]|uniref:sorting nexin-10 isoform X2 n=1 Tax=Oryzias latipes TaxID=8090 RepID=UPI0009D93DC3|nr:sorting nexin-10 isoform X2 [Oryzias latipes]
MRRGSGSTVNQQAISVWVRDPRIQKNDFWHAYIDYEICLHTDSVFLTKKTSRVRRRYSEFVWLRQKLQENALLMVLQSRLLLSDSCLHLFLQSDLSVSMIEACAAGRTNFSVAQAVQRSGLRRFHSEDDLPKEISRSCESDSDSSESRDSEEKIRDLAVNKVRSTGSLDLLDSSYRTRTRHSDAYL